MENNRIIHRERKKDCDVNIDYKSMNNEELESTIINSIVISTVGGNNEKMNFHCKELSKIERNAEKHSLILINILFSKFMNYDKQHQEILIIYIKRWFEKYLYTESKLETINVETYIQGLINLIISQNLNKKIKDHIKDLLKEFLFYYYNLFNNGKNNKPLDNNNFKIFFNNINKLIYEQVESNLMTRNFNNILDYLSIYETLIMRNNLLLHDNETFDNFILVIELIMKNIKLFHIQTHSNEDDRDKNHDYNIVRDISNIILTLISDNISNLKNDNTAKLINSNNIFLNNLRFNSVLKDFLNLNENFDTVCSPDSIVILNESKSFLNNFKGGIIENLSKANEFIKQHFFYSLCHNYSEYIHILYTQTVRALDNIISKSIIEEKEEMSWKIIEFNNYVAKLLSFLKSCINFSPCEQLFLDNQLEILRLLILPLIRITKLERSYFKKEPENYLSHILDFANEHQVEGPKSTALFLLEEMCKKIDGFLKIVVFLYIESLNYVISKSNSSMISVITMMANKNVLNLYQYIQTLSDEEIIEQSLQVLSMLSCHIFLRKDLVIYYNNAFAKINPILIQINEEFLKSKLCLFFSFNLDDLFRDGSNVHQENFYSSFNFLFDCLSGNNKYITVNLQALDSLNSLLFDKNLIGLLRTYIKSKIPDIYKVFNNNEITKTNMFLELMKGLIQYYYKDLGDEIYVIFNYFWSNFKNELETKKENKSMSIKTRKIYDWINNLKIILSSNHAGKSIMYQEVFPFLTDLIHKFYGCEYEEEIFQILKIINKEIKSIPDKYVCKLEDLIISLEKNNYHIEKYHLEYLISFLNGLSPHHLIQYKQTLFIFIKKLLFLEHRNVSLMMSKKYIASSLLFMYIIVYRDHLQNNDYVEILDILYSGVTSNHVVQPDYVKRLCDCFMFIVIITFINGTIYNFLKKELKIFEILLVKWINLTEKFKNKLESCMSIIFISYVIQFMISEFNECWSALLKSSISAGIDELVFYKKLLSDEYQKIKEQKNEKTDLDTAIIGKKSTETHKYDENGNQIDVEIINENNDESRLNKLKKMLKDSDEEDLDSDVSDDIDDEDEEFDESEENSDSIEEMLKENDKILTRDDVLKNIFERKNKENRNDDDSFFVKKNINKIEFSKIMTEFPEVIDFINKIDEIQLFKETISILNHKYPKIYNQIINSLAPIKLTLFKKILELSKINIDNKTYLRTIKKIKK